MLFFKQTGDCRRFIPSFLNFIRENRF